jgi:hypothetical protein
LWPEGGVQKAHGYQRQPPYTAVSAENVRTTGTLEGRRRGGSRPGLTRFMASQIGGAYATAEAATVTGVHDSGLTTLTASRIAFDLDWVGRSITITSTGTFVIASVESTTVMRVTGNATCSAKAFTLDGSPVNMVVPIDYLPIAYRQRWEDDFSNGTYLDELYSPWEDLTGYTTRPVYYPAAEGEHYAAARSANRVTGALHAGLPIDVTADYKFIMYIMPREGSHRGQYQFFFRMDDNAPDPATDGVIADLYLRGTAGAYSGTLTVNVAGSPTVYDFAGGSTPGQTPAVEVFTVAVSGNDITCQMGPQMLLDAQTISAPTGTRWGFGINNVDTPETGGDPEPQVDRISVVFLNTKALGDEHRRLLVASAGGRLYREGDLGDLEVYAPSNELRLAHDRRLYAAQHNNLLYIADRQLVASGADGIIASNDFSTTATITQFKDLDMSPLTDYVVSLTTSVGVFHGNFTISAYTGAPDGSELTLVAAGGLPTDDSNYAYEIHRSPKVYDPTSAGGGALTLWAGTNTNPIPLGCTHICRYRDRVVLAGQFDFPHLWYMSKQGDPTDWAYGAEPGDAVAAASADAGGIGEPINALIPHGDDYLLFGCRDSIWMLRGDPTYGGSLGNVSRNVGIVGPSAWCYTPDGHIVFMSRHGLYILPGAGDAKPQPLSEFVLPREFQSVDSENAVVQLAYDMNDDGIHVFLTTVIPATVRHYWIDWRAKAFWPVVLTAAHEPFSSIAYQADSPEQTSVLLGGRDGILRRFYPSAGYDEGLSFASEVWYGPFRLSGNDIDEGLLLELHGDLSANSGDVTWAVHVGDTAEAAKDASAFDSGTWTAGANYAVMPRARGTTAFVKVSGTAGSPWAIEGIRMVRAAAGRRRLA